MDFKSRASIQESFDAFDTDANGMIDLIEFRKLLKKIRSDLGRAEAEAAFDSVDTDENGLIEFDEFYKWWTER